MNDRQPWSVRGVDREARDLAVRAAHERRMTIGEWLSETVIEAARRDLDELAAEAGSSGLPAKQDRTGELAGALGALVNHLEKSGGLPGELANRIGRTEAVLTGRMEQIAAAMYGVMQTVEKQGTRTVDGDDGALAEQQARMAEQISAIAEAEQRRDQQMGAIAEALTMLATKGETPQAPAPATPETDDADDVEEPLIVDAVTDDDAPLAYGDPVATEEPPAPDERDDKSLSVGETPEAEPLTGGPDDDEDEPLTLSDPVTPERPEPQFGPGLGAYNPSSPTYQPRHQNPRAEEVNREIRESASSPPGMMDDDDDGGRRRGFFGRMFRRG
ncbi:MAG: hypothetical protein GDA49_09205 [Rhodospirillales bacterium]|nr:hypothetical protein [Rhodospirillales bacterium]